MLICTFCISRCCILSLNWYGSSIDNHGSHIHIVTTSKFDNFENWRLPNLIHQVFIRLLLMSPWLIRRAPQGAYEPQEDPEVRFNCLESQFDEFMYNLVGILHSRSSSTRIRAGCGSHRGTGICGSRQPRACPRSRVAVPRTTMGRW